MADDYITRKEFEERLSLMKASFDDRHNGIQSQLSEALGIVKTNNSQIGALTISMTELQKAMAALDKAVAIAASMNKYLWPIVTGLATFSAYLLAGGHL